LCKLEETAVIKMHSVSGSFGLWRYMIMVDINSLKA
jgi:hypothetical protein